jgi:hypothetical protein
MFPVEDEDNFKWNFEWKKQVSKSWTNLL